MITEYQSYGVYEAFHKVELNRKCIFKSVGRVQNGYRLRLYSGAFVPWGKRQSLH